MLIVKDLVGGYSGDTVLHDLRLELQSGEVLALIGPNGSGKTSLLRAISGLLPRQRGEVRFHSTSLLSLSPRQRARQLAVVPQAAHLPPAFTVWETVSLGRTPHLNWLGQLGPKDEERIHWALEVTELTPLREHRVGELSGGEQQRVLLGRALAQDCPILLLDEPTAHLDLHHQVAFLTLIRRMAAENRLGVLIALHDLNLAALYADRLILLVNGRALASGSPSEVLTESHLQNAYQVPVRVQQDAATGTSRVFIAAEKGI